MPLSLSSGLRLTAAAFTAFMLIYSIGPSGWLPSVHAEQDALQQQQDAFLIALSEKNPERVAGYFTEQGVVHIANMPAIQGRSAILRLYENVFRFQSSAEYSPGPVQISESADMAYTTGRVTTFFEGADGLAEYPGKYLLIWEKHDGEWLIAVYSISNNRTEVNE